MRKRLTASHGVESIWPRRIDYWAIRSSICSFTCTTHSFACSALLALLARSAALIRSLACSLTHSGAYGKGGFCLWNKRVNLISFKPTVRRPCRFFFSAGLQNGFDFTIRQSRGVIGHWFGQWPSLPLPTPSPNGVRINWLEKCTQQLEKFMSCLLFVFEYRSKWFFISAQICWRILRLSAQSPFSWREMLLLNRVPNQPHLFFTFIGKEN